MNKKIAIFSILFLVSNVNGLEKTILTDFNTQEEIKGFKPTQNSNFQILITTGSSIILHNSSSRVNRIKEDNVMWQIDYIDTSNGRRWLTGTTGSRKTLLIDGNGEIIEKIRHYHDRGKFISKNLFYVSNSFNTNLYNLDGKLVEDLKVDGLLRNLLAAKDFDSDGKDELVTRDDGMTDLTVIDEGNTIEWRIQEDIPSKARYIGKKILTLSPDSVELRHPSNGSIVWSREVSGPVSPVRTGGELVFFEGEKARIVDLGDGELLKEKELEKEVSDARKLPGRNVIAGIQAGNISFFSLGGEKLDSFAAQGVEGFRLAEYDQDGEMELALKRPKNVRIVDFELGEDRESLNRSLNNTVFVGNGRELLKAVALDRPVFVTESFSRVKEAARELGNPIGVGDINGIKSVENLNRAFNVSGKRFYVEDMRKAVYVAALASEKNASLTFDREKADRNFSNYSVGELQQLFIEEFRPNHVAVADLESGKGILASYMAAEAGMMPIHWNSSYSYPEDHTVEEINEENRVGKLEQRIESVFERIGENRNTILEGKYISLLDAPSRVRKDPVEKGFLSSDPADGGSYRTDLSYGNLDSDKFLEAGVGRYPPGKAEASELFHRSLKRKLGDRALVASEYLHSNWPVVLATFGGGLRHGSGLESVFREQGFNTTHIVEYRSEPVKFLTGLTPVSIRGFLKEADSTSSKIANIAGSTAGSLAKNALIILKAADYAEQIVEMYYEFRWKTFRIDLGRGLERMKELNISIEEKEDIQKSVMKALYAFIWPERHPHLGDMKLQKGMKNADIVYYTGVGNSSSWTMPNNDTSTLKNRYSGVNRFTAGEIPEMQRAIVWDNSNLAGTRGAEMRREFIDENVSAFIGFSSVNYAPYSSIIGYNFFKYRKSLGNSQKKGVNSLRARSLVYNPASFLKSGVQQKMEESLKMYGNPEMRKDPVRDQNFKVKRECSGKTCELNITIETPQRVVETGGGKTLVANSSSYILQPGAPITPLYYGSFEIPDSAEVESIEKNVVKKSYRSLELGRHRFLSHGGRFVNSTIEYGEFPDRKLNVTVGGDVTIGVSGAQSHGKKTEIVKKASVEVEYASPLTLDFSADGKKLEAEIHSSSERRARLIYTAGNTTQTRDVNIDREVNSFKLKNLSYGETEVRGFLISGNITVSDREELTVARPVDVVSFAPKLRLGESSGGKPQQFFSDPRNSSQDRRERSSRNA